MQRLTRVSLEHPRVVLGALALVTALLGSGLPVVHSEYGYEVLIGHDHPAVVNLERQVATFGGGAAIKLAWECGPQWPCTHPLDVQSLAMAHAVSQAMAQLNEVQRVHSPSNATLIVSDEAGFAVRRLIEHDRVVDDRAALVERARADRLWQGVLMSADESVGVMHVQPRDTGIHTGEVVLDSLFDVLAPWQEAGFEFAIVGNNVSGILGGRALDESIGQLIPALVVVIALVLLVLARSWRQSGLVLGSMGVAVLWTFGVLGHLAWPQDGILEVLAPLVLVVGVCDAVHFVSRCSEHERRGDTRREALLHAARDVGPACVATTATTGVAFLSFATSSLDTFIRFGSIAAFGVIACLVLTFTLLPILLEQFGWRGQLARPVRWDAALLATLRLAPRRAGTVLAAVALLLAIAVAGVFRIVVDTDWEEMMGRHHPSIQWMDFLAQRVGRSETLELMIELPDSVLLAEPETLETIDRMGESIASATVFGEASSLIDAIERLNRALHEDDPAFERIAETHDGNAELIEMLAFDDPGLLATWLSTDRRAVRISLGGAIPTHQEERLAVAAAERVAREHLPADWSVMLTGEPVVTAAFIRDVTATQVRSFPVAVGLVFVIASLYFRSPRLGAAAVLPTVLPALAALGAMGWLGMKLDIGRAMVAAVIIGVGVDDAIHLLSAYRIARIADHEPRDAMRAALLRTGPALVMTSVALALGFLTLRLAAWATIASFGALVACSILGALASILLLLPAGVELADRQLRKSRRNRLDVNETGQFQTATRG